ncbi:MAG: hypothetical protein WBA12_09340, partial [Catalinimonas sp.]
MWASALFLFLASCQDPVDDLGRNLPGLGTPLKVLVDSFPVGTRVVQFEAAQSSQRFYGEGARFHTLVVGRLNDPAFGDTRAEAYFQMQTIRRKVELSPGSRFDSMEVSINQPFF